MDNDASIHPSIQTYEEIGARILSKSLCGKQSALNVYGKNMANVEIQWEMLIKI